METVRKAQIVHRYMFHFMIKADKGYKYNVVGHRNVEICLQMPVL